MAVLHPDKVTLSKARGKVEEVVMEKIPTIPKWRKEIAFLRTLYIDTDDFMEEPPKKFFRHAPGAESAPKGAYIIRCESVVKDESGNVTELSCSVDLASKSARKAPTASQRDAPLDRALDARPYEARLYRHHQHEEPSKAEPGEEEKIPRRARGAEAPAAKGFHQPVIPLS
jgi:glutaminyl-tRNA synthetase